MSTTAVSRRLVLRTRFARALAAKRHVEDIEEGLVQLRWIEEESSSRSQVLARVRRRCRGEPLQYVLESTYFGPCRLACRPPILIPRPATEHWVQELTRRTVKRDDLLVLEIGTGSGAIPILLKKLRPSWRLYAIDSSPAAIALAEKNARANNVSIGFSTMDVFQANFVAALRSWTGHRHFDVILSNPPYLTAGDYKDLDASVKAWEDRSALLSDIDDDGLGFHRRITSLARDGDGLLSARSAILALEIGSRRQGEILRREWGREAECWKDAFGDDRAVVWHR